MKKQVPRRNTAGKTTRRASGSVLALVKTLDELRCASLRGDGKDPDDEDRYVLHGPPTKTELAAHLKLWPDLPPSYVEFLRHHAGWQGFWGGTSLLGPKTKRNASQWKATLRDLANLDRFLDEDLDPEDLTQIQKADAIPFAYRDNGGLLAFDRRKPAAGGELAVVDCIRANGCVDNRHDNFVAFLTNRVACTKGKIARRGD